MAKARWIQTLLWVSLMPEWSESATTKYAISVVQQDDGVAQYK